MIFGDSAGGLSCAHLTANRQLLRGHPPTGSRSTQPGPALRFSNPEVGSASAACCFALTGGAIDQRYAAAKFIGATKPAAHVSYVVLGLMEMREMMEGHQPAFLLRHAVNGGEGIPVGGHLMSEAINIGSVDDIDEGEAIVIPAEDNGTTDDIAVFHAEDGNFYAINDECTHETASLADGWIEGTEVECPVHAAKFCLKSGEALCLPATVAARTHKIEVQDGELMLYPDTPVV